MGVATWALGAPDSDGDRTTSISFSWLDSVEFHDGTEVASMGRFAKSRPPGLVVIAIIAVLIGLRVPAIQ